MPVTVVFVEESEIILVTSATAPGPIGPRGPAGAGTVDTIVEGANISIDDTDPENPVVSATGLLTSDDADNSYVALLAHGTTVGLASITGGGDLVIDITTQWGIGVDGPYYDTVAVDTGEEALFHIEPDATASWVLVSEVH